MYSFESGKGGKNHLSLQVLIKFERLFNQGSMKFQLCLIMWRRSELNDDPRILARCVYSSHNEALIGLLRLKLFVSYFGRLEHDRQGRLTVMLT